QYNRSPHSETGRPPADYFVQDNSINVPNKSHWKLPKKFTPYEVGQLVLRKSPPQAAGETDKLGPRYQGPLEIIKADSNGITYQAKFLTGARKVVQLHASRMKHFHGQWKETECTSPSAPSKDPTPEPQRKRSSTPTEDVFQLDYGLWADIPINLTATRVPDVSIPPVVIVPSSPSSPVTPPVVVPSPGGEMKLELSPMPVDMPSPIYQPLSFENDENELPLLDQSAESECPNIFSTDNLQQLHLSSQEEIQSSPSVLGEDLENDIGDWPMDPDNSSSSLEGVLSDHCVRGGLVSTPVDEAPALAEPISAPVEPPQRRPRTRAMARAAAAEAAGELVSKRLTYTESSSDDSQIYYSDENTSSIVRNIPESQLLQDSLVFDPIETYCENFCLSD
ncbi:MAG: hypothetical protein AAGM67_14580, partial [Bacteroidota bacterium]